MTARCWWKSRPSPRFPRIDSSGPERTYFADLLSGVGTHRGVQAVCAPGRILDIAVAGAVVVDPLVLRQRGAFLRDRATGQQGCAEEDRDGSEARHVVLHDLSA